MHETITLQKQVYEYSFLKLTIFNLLFDLHVQEISEYQEIDNFVIVYNTRSLSMVRHTYVCQESRYTALKPLFYKKL